MRESRFPDALSDRSTDLTSRAPRNLIANICVFALLACAAGLSNAAGNSAVLSADRCPIVNTLTRAPDPGHWYSPKQQNAYDHVPNQCNSCLDPDNADQRACGVSKLIHSGECSGLHCGDDEGEFFLYPKLPWQIGLQHDLRFRDPDRFKGAQGEDCRFIQWALRPVIGVEDVNLRTSLNYWRLAYLASQSLVEPPFPDHRLAIAIQPPTNRGQHQLHLHIGTLGAGYRGAIDSLRREPGATQTIVIGEFEFVAQYVPNGTPAEPLTGANPFDVATRMIPGGEASMPLYGMLVAVAKGGEGVFVLAAQKFDRRALNYRQIYSCGFAPQPKIPD